MIILIIKYSQNQLIDVSIMCSSHSELLCCIVTAFDPDQLDGRPEDQMITGEVKSGTPAVTLSSDELLATQQLIGKCYSYCRVSTAAAASVYYMMVYSIEVL